MPWARIEGGLFRNPKVAGVGPLAKLLYIAGLAYCADQLSDGRIARASVRLIAAEADVDPSLASDLVAAGLWEELPDGGGYQVHDWPVYNPPAEEYRAKQDEKRLARSEAGRRGAAARWQTDGKSMRSQCDSDAIAMANAWQTDGTDTDTDNRDPIPRSDPEIEPDDDRAIAREAADAPVVASDGSVSDEPLKLWTTHFGLPTRKVKLELDRLDRLCVGHLRPMLLGQVLVYAATRVDRDRPPGAWLKYIDTTLRAHIRDGTIPDDAVAPSKRNGHHAPPRSAYRAANAWTDDEWAAYMAGRAEPEEPPPEAEPAPDSYETFLARRREHDRAVAAGAAPPGRGRDRDQ